MRVIYSGSFDPITKGHEWIIEQASKLFKEVIVVIALNPEKRYMFSEKKRYNMVNKVIEQYNNVKVETIENQYLIDYAQSNNVTHIIRGIRNESDFAYEKTLQHFNSKQANEIQTIYLIPPKELEDISSSFVKGLVGYNGWQDIISEYIHPYVDKTIKTQWLEDRWLEGPCTFLDIDSPMMRFEKIIEAYSSKNRHYHNLNHLINCLTLCQEFNVSQFVEYALWYHDIAENEEDSIEKAIKLATIKDSEDKIWNKHVSELIQITDHKTSTDNDKSKQLIKDIDLSVLAYPRKRYEQYKNQIRQEYDYVEDDIFNSARTQILQRFLDMDRIYQTDKFYDRYEAQARKNIEWEIRELKK